MSIRLKQKEGKSGMISLFIETYKGWICKQKVQLKLSYIFVNII